MPKMRRGNQLVQCTHCHGQGFIKVRSGGQRGQMFESSVEALASNRKPFEQAPVPEFQGVLSPGESRKSFVYQKWDFGDLLKAAGLAILSGAFFGIPALVICIPVRAKWHWPVGSFLVPMLVVWVIKAADLIGGDSTIVRENRVSRPPEPAPPAPAEPPVVEVVINSGKVQRRAKLRAPKSNPAGLWQYADALVRGTAEPSIEGGKHVLGAKAFGYTPAEFDGRSDCWRPTAIAGDILEEDPEKSRGYRLTEDGRRAMAVVAEKRLGEWG